MKKSLYIVILLISAIVISGCSNTADESTRATVDSLNEQSVRMLYLSAEKSESLARRAVALSDHYKDGRMEAECNIASARIMKMEYDTAAVILHDVLSSTNNSLYKFLADCRMMKICQVEASNKEFYEYRTDAERRIERIAADEEGMNHHQQIVWRIANCLYNLTLTSHFHNLRYMEEMDMARSMYTDWYQSLGPDSVILEPMFRHYDLNHWKKYGNLYYESMALVNIADTLSLAGKNQDALDSLDHALECINTFYGIKNDADKLCVFDMMAMDSISKEMQWIKNPDIITIPEWMIAIREELSIVYGALGMKEASDYNHNIYFDILDATRQDMSLQERQERLEHEDNIVNGLLFGLAVLFVVVIYVLVVLYRKGARRSTQRVERMSKLIDICTVMTAAMPTEAADEEDVATAVHNAVDEDVKSLFPDISDEWTSHDTSQMDIFEREMLSVLQVLYRWIIQNSQVIIAMTEESERVESEMYVHGKRVEDNKRQYIDKATSVSIVNGITPFLDRAIREVNKLKECGILERRDEMNQRLEYVKELVEKIEAFNEVLGHWVKIRQGAVTLNIENFALQPLLDTLAKGKPMFDAKHIMLDIPQSEAVVKADAALTLFMMNTLMDNARKYTPEGGTVRISTEVCDDYVEVSVKDSGHGLSEEDCDTLNNSKVYDSSKIGVAHDADGQVRQNKGFGFGLMNCRGIIEKYKKTNSVFSVCAFGVESHLNEGSRFFFRLPKGVIRTLVLIMAMLVTTSVSAADNGNMTVIKDSRELNLAISYYDSLFNCNVNRDYERAIEFADSAIIHLNNHYLKSNPDGTLLMQLDGEDDDMPELILQKIGFDTDYQTIVEIRNEIAISALALNRRHLYSYNNEIFTRLYKQLSDDHSTEDYCNDIQESTSVKQVVFTLAVFMLLVLLLGYALLYYRHNLLYIFNMREFLQFMHHLFGSSDDNIYSCLYHGMNEVRSVEAIGIAMTDVNSNDDSLNFTYEGNTECRGMLGQFMTLCYNRKSRLSNERERFLAYPLTVMVDGERQCIGSVGLMLHDAHISKNDDLSLQLMVEFFAMYSYFCFTRVDIQKADLELREDEMRRIEQEDSKIHIQNMVLDNYLSTIKHETMYYPGRIRQIAEAAITEPTDERMKDLAEITMYYKEVFSLLSSGAGKQLERRVFKREKVSVAEMAKYAKRMFDKRNRKLMLPITLEIGDVPADLYIMTDRIMANYMIDTLLSGAFECETAGLLTLSFVKSDKFVKFAFSDSRIDYTEEQLSELFYADSIRYDEVTGVLHGQQFLLLKQMVREHDEMSGHKGCRIYAEAMPDGGMTLNMEL